MLEGSRKTKMSQVTQVRGDRPGKLVLERKSLRKDQGEAEAVWCIHDSEDKTEK